MESATTHEAASNEAPPRERVPFAHPFANGRELELVDEVLGSGVLRDGPMLRRFEERYAHVAGARQAVAVTSPVAALQLVAATGGWGAGDEVVTSPFATVAAGMLERVAGVRTHVVDIDPITLGAASDAVIEAVGPRTRAVIVTDSFGWPTELSAVASRIERRDVLVVADAAGAIAASVPGVVRMFVLDSDVELTTGSGAVLCSDDDALVHTWRDLSGPGAFDSRLGDMAAAIGLAQLERLPRTVAMREMVAADYARMLEQVDGISLPVAVRDDTARAWSRYWVLVDDAGTREHVLAALASHGIDTRLPAPVEPDPRTVPVASDIAARALALPCFPQLSPQQQERIVAVLRDAVSTA